MIGKIRDNLIGTYAYLWRVMTSHVPVGTNIYEKDWDLLIVLDACRVDALKEVQHEYEFISSVEEVSSLGSTSPEWIDNTFIEEYLNEIQSTSYITANAYSDRHVRTGSVNHLETAETRGTIYEESNLAKKFINNDTVSGEFTSFELVEGTKLAESDTKQYFHPDLVTAQAIETARTEDPDRMIVHYMQPHAPYIAEACKKGYFETYEESPFEYIKRGGDLSTVWSAYLDNLRLALGSVEVLLNNVEAETAVITADHGELFGEWGLYSHIYGIPHPDLRKVPWVETTAKNNKTISPEKIRSSHNAVADNDEEVESRLSALGYIS